MWSSEEPVFDAPHMLKIWINNFPSFEHRLYMIVPVKWTFVHKAFLCYVTVNFQFDFNGVQPLGSTLLSVGTVILLLFPVIRKTVLVRGAFHTHGINIFSNHYLSRNIHTTKNQSLTLRRVDFWRQVRISFIALHSITFWGDSDCSYL